MKRLVLALAVAALMSIVGVPAVAQSYPQRPIKLIVPFAPGGIVDFVGRALAQRLEAQMGQPIVVDNRNTGGSLVGIASVANAEPDGYTMMVVDPSVVINPAMKPNPPYQMTQLKVIATLTTNPLMVVVNPSVPASNLKELIEYSKKAPGGISYASAGIGTTTHLGPELLKVQSGLSATHIPYRGGGLSIPDLVSGRTHVAMYSNALVLPLVNDQKLRAIAQTGSRRAEANPDVPTGVESGFPDFVVELWTGLFVPAGVPEDVARRLADEVKKATESEEFKRALRTGGTEMFYKDSAAAAAYVKAEQEKWTGLIKAAKLGEN